MRMSPGHAPARRTKRSPNRTCLVEMCYPGSQAGLLAARLPGRRGPVDIHLPRRATYFCQSHAAKGFRTGTTPDLNWTTHESELQSTRPTHTSFLSGDLT